MRFSLLLLAFAVVSPILAVPVPGGGRKPGTNSKPVDANKPVAAANPGDVVLVKSEDFLGKDVGSGSSKRKIHPAIVTHHEPGTHIVHVAPIGHEHPGGVPTMPGRDVGLPETPDKTAKQSLVSLGPPKLIHQKDVVALKDLPEGATRDPMPKKLTDEHFQHLQAQLAANAPPVASASGSEKGKGKKKLDKREFELELEERDILDGMFDDEW